MDLSAVLAECQEISEFLGRIIPTDGDGGLEEGLVMCLQDMDDPDRLLPFVRFPCKSAEELGFHVCELSLGNPYTRPLVRDVGTPAHALFSQSGH